MYSLSIICLFEHVEPYCTPEQLDESYKTLGVRKRGEWKGVSYTLLFHLKA